MPQPKDPLMSVMRIAPSYWGNEGLGQGELLPPDHTLSVPKKAITLMSMILGQ
jgi:hypothetical protein